MWCRANPSCHLGRVQGCQIFFIYSRYKNEGKYTKLPLNYQMAIKYTKWS
jgi:hypothetical protein